MFDDEPYGYDTDGDGWLDGENRGSLWEYDFDGDGDIDINDEFIGDFLAYEAHQAGGGCFIATAVYGDYDHPQVRVLRRFRDQILMKSAVGERFVRWYYRVGPGVAKYVKNNLLVSFGFRVLCDCLIDILRMNTKNDCTL